MSKALLPLLLLVFLPTSLFGQLHQWDGQNSGDNFGGALSIAGDVNGDGFDDLIIGASKSGNNGVNSGSAYVYSGVNGALIYTWGGQNPSDHLGCAVSGAGDTNGDGIDELLIGAYGSDNNGSSSGSAYIYEVSTFYSTTDLFAGDPIPAVFTIAGAAPNSSVTLGYSFAGAGPFTTVFGIVDMTPPINTLAVLSADANGDASWVVNVPPSAHGRTLYTQALNTGLLTNSLAIDIN